MPCTITESGAARVLPPFTTVTVWNTWRKWNTAIAIEKQELQRVSVEFELAELRRQRASRAFRRALLRWQIETHRIKLEDTRSSRADIADEFAAALKKLPSEAQSALSDVRERVARDSLPLLSLLQADPLEMQSSHLSFQEYYAATAIRSGRYRLPAGVPPPWEWPVSFANTVKFGGEMGEAFGEGLAQTAGVAAVVGEDFKKELSGHLPTALVTMVELEVPEVED